MRPQITRITPRAVVYLTICVLCVICELVHYENRCRNVPHGINAYLSTKYVTHTIAGVAKRSNVYRCCVTDIRGELAYAELALAFVLVTKH